MPHESSGEKSPRPSWADDERSVERAVRRFLVLAPGALLARKYRLTRPAGFGGMAELWVAVNEATGAEVCIKILVVPESEDEDVAERFRREAHAAARLAHRAIVRVFDLVELTVDGDTLTSGAPAALAIVMELLHGETLAELIVRKGRLDFEETVDLALPIISALAHAHRAGVVHRDLKPDNIFVADEPDGHVIPKVLDFGVSKVAGPAPITLDGVVLGTPSFMSPEQARGSRHIDARSDVFSLGTLVYVMLAGDNPFESENFHSVVQAIQQAAPPRLPLATSHPEAWDVLERALSKDASSRYADAGELGAALRRATGRASVDSGPYRVLDGTRLAAVSVAPSSLAARSLAAPAATAPEPPEPLAPRQRRSRTAVVVVMLIATLLAIGALLAALGQAKLR